MKANGFFSHKKHIFYHLLGWIVFIAYEVSIIIIIEGESGRHTPLRLFLVPYALNILLFYFHAYIVIGYCFSDEKRNFALFFILLVTEISLYIFLVSQLQPVSQPKKRFLFFYFTTNAVFARTLWRAIYFMIFSTAYWIINRSFKRIRRMKDIEKKALIEEKERQRLQLELVSTQNAFLQAQINPHLLFNTLNFIHSEVQEVSEKASDAIITLSDMMRYSLIENKMDGKVPLAREIEQIENLVKINQYRFANRLSLQMQIRGDLENARIVPLLLIPFVENIFKYADLTDESNPARIHLEMENQVLQFYTYNKKRKTVSFSSPGIGINNVKTRLQASYPDSFSLQLDEGDSFFSVHLKMII